MDVTITGQVITSAGSTIFNTATVTGNIQNKGVTATDSEITTVRPAVDLTITKADSPDPVCAASWPGPGYPAGVDYPAGAVCQGGLTYTFVIGNSGVDPAGATNVVVRDPLPAGTIFDQAINVDGGGFVCSLRRARQRRHLQRRHGAAAIDAHAEVHPRRPGRGRSDQQHRDGGSEQRDLRSRRNQQHLHPGDAGLDRHRPDGGEAQQSRSGLRGHARHADLHDQGAEPRHAGCDEHPRPRHAAGGHDLPRRGGRSRPRLLLLAGRRHRELLGRTRPGHQEHELSEPRRHRRRCGDDHHPHLRHGLRAGRRCTTKCGSIRSTPFPRRTS